MAARAIAEREEAVAKLEGEKASLEKLLAEREKEQAQEVSSIHGDIITLACANFRDLVNMMIYSGTQ
jgi:hypothetical protein